MSCAICEVRKEKRFCPAVHDRICPRCCGTEREVTLDCPSECVFLQQARAHGLKVIVRVEVPVIRVPAEPVSRVIPPD